MLQKQLLYWPTIIICAALHEAPGFDGMHACSAVYIIITIWPVLTPMQMSNWFSCCWFMQDQRPPSRQKPPPEALHLFQPMHGSSSGGFAPSPVFRAAPAGTTRPSTSAAIMLQTAAPRCKPSAVLHTGRMTLEDLQKLSDAAVNNSQAIAAGGIPGDRLPIRPYRPPSARPTSARPPSAR